MADTKYFAVVTDLGAREMMKAVNEKRKVNITQFAAGDGGGQYYVPDTAMTELRNEVWRGGINTCEISKESENVMIVETVIPSNEGGFTIREMAVFDDNGNMIAVCNTPDTAKVRVTDGVVHELVLKMEILLNNKDSVQIVTDPNIVVATKEDVLELQEKIEAALEYFSGESVENAFHEVFDGETGENDSGAMMAGEIESAINMVWDGNSSLDPTAMTKEEVEEGTSTVWNGQASADTEALKPNEIESATPLS